eukprot:TRINITY_DN76955_c0_g1_i1.p1 TRINITY_DN76955_c0_g1~~TRINITY_DN76955_c0_g1_i1.p1  ORF type:complete len:608 (-),score=45.34 TRINITY_DN76955_c0_g1_i1:860-2683(-)
MARDASEPPMEYGSENVWSRRILTRQRQIDIGKARPEYSKFRQLVPRRDLSSGRPVTPDPSMRISKRAFDRELSTWRRRLHAFDLNLSPDITFAPVLDRITDSSDETQHTSYTPGREANGAYVVSETSPAMASTHADSGTCLMRSSVPILRDVGVQATAPNCLDTHQNGKLNLADRLPKPQIGLPTAASAIPGLSWNSVHTNAAVAAASAAVAAGPAPSLGLSTMAAASSRLSSTGFTPATAMVLPTFAGPRGLGGGVNCGTPCNWISVGVPTGAASQHTSQCQTPAVGSIPHPPWLQLGNAISQQAVLVPSTQLVGSCPQTPVCVQQFTLVASGMASASGPAVGLVTPVDSVTSPNTSTTEPTRQITRVALESQLSWSPKQLSEGHSPLVSSGSRTTENPTLDSSTCELESASSDSCLKTPRARLVSGDVAEVSETPPKQAAQAYCEQAPTTPTKPSRSTRVDSTSMETPPETPPRWIEYGSIAKSTPSVSDGSSGSVGVTLHWGVPTGTPVMPFTVGSPCVFSFCRPAPHIVTPASAQPPPLPSSTGYCGSPPEVRCRQQQKAHTHGLTPGPRPGVARTRGDVERSPQFDMLSSAACMAEWRKSG